MAIAGWSSVGVNTLPGTSGTKHTGERPFTCHCGKQFSRLDNLRQHAQTVHADKQDQNERMMQELTSLHASMSAASKGGPARGKRASAANSNPSSTSPTAAALDGSVPSMSIKQEDSLAAMSAVHPRPGTSTGYEDGNGLMYHTGPWQVPSNVDRRSGNSHSFRDSSQSFRAPASNSPTSGSPTAPAFPQQQLQQQHSGQSFLVPPSTSFNFSLPNIPDSSASSTRPGSSSGPRPPSADNNRSLPPISTIVAASLPSALSLPHQPYLSGSAFGLPHEQLRPPSSLTSSHILPLPTPSAHYIHSRRPSTATRPGTAPASFYYSAANAFAPGSGSLPPLASSREHRPELSLSFLSGHGRYSGGAESVLRSTAVADPGDEPTSPNNYESPFSFHAPSTTAAAATSSSASFTDYRPTSSVPNPRKRPHSGSDDDVPRGRGDAGRPISSSGGRRPGTSGLPSFAAHASEYEYGSESRPQSRRLSVMELCNNDDDADAATRPFIPFPSAASVSRPTTSSGLVTSASQLALVDRPTPPPPAIAAANSAATTGSPASTHSYLSRSSSPEHVRTSPSLFTRASYAAGGATAPTAAGAEFPRGAAAATRASGTRTSEFGGGIPSSASWGLSGYSQQQPQSPLSRSSNGGSPLLSRSAGGGSTAAASGGGHLYYRTHSPTASPPAGRYHSGRAPGAVSPVSDAGSSSGGLSPGGRSTGAGSSGGESQRGNDQGTL
ncbi:unnamed protein product [Somion occarium]|uniref:C2H2-type domain-containing protein n=1 Tax=Somion occarium TaxID=3059160 RepID=A0ABP1D595_9APHY